MPTLVTVEQSHIDKGMPGVSGFCPIALALSDSLDGFWSVGMVVVERLPRNGRCFSLPPEARKFVRDFDGGFLVNPFEFELGVE